MEKKRYEVEGFSFANEEQAKQAQKEIAGIKYIQSRVDMDNPEMVLQIYNKTIREKLFETPVGLAYLRNLWEKLNEVPYIKEGEILSIPVEDHTKIEIKSTRQKKKHGNKKEDTKMDSMEEFQKGQILTEKNIDFKKRYKRAFFFAVVFFVMVVSMFAVTLTSNSVTILNYENKIINQYEDWEQELSEREQKLNEREAALDDKDTVSP